jgi:DNA repair exonuclease SbcCD nuclease subunit
MAKILLFSDLHIHSHKQSLQRLQDCLDVLRWAFQTARDNNVKHVIFLGDLFHDRQKIQVIVYHNTFQIFEEYSDLNINLLLGNHDLWFYDKWDISSVMPLSAMSNVSVIGKPCTKKIADIDVDFLPFTHDPVEVLSNFKDKSSLLCAHIAVDDATLNELYNTKAEVSIENEKDVVKVSKDIFKGWRRVLLGHYHCPQRLDDRVEYIGSPIQLSFNEAFQSKHIVILDTDTMECKYIENTFSPKHVIVRYDELNSLKLDNNFVQVQVEDVDASDVIEIRKEINDRCNVQSLEFKELKTRNVQINSKELQAKFDIANGDVLERYIATVGIGDLNYNKLLQIGKEICHEN